MKSLWEATGCSADISCLCYSHGLHQYFLVSTDFKLHVLNEYLNHIGSYGLKMRMIMYLHFDDASSTLIACSIDGTYTLSYNFKSEANHNPRMSLSMDPEGKKVSADLGDPVPLDQMPVWIKGMRVLDKLGMITSWS